MDGVAVERLAQRLCAGERGKKRHLGLGGQRQGGQAGGRAHVAEQGKHLVLDQLFGVGCAAGGLVAVVQAFEFDAPPVDPAFGIDLVENHLCAEVVLDAQLFGGAAERGRLAQHHGAVGDAVGPGSAGGSQAGQCGGLNGGAQQSASLHKMRFPWGDW